LLTAKSSAIKLFVFKKEKKSKRKKDRACISKK